MPVAVYNLLTFKRISYGPLATAALVVTTPVLLLARLMQSEMIAGLTAGGVKAGGWIVACSSARDLLWMAIGHRWITRPCIKHER